MASSLINYDPTMLAPHDWGFPVPIAYGPGRLSEIGQRCVALGIKNPLIVTDRGSRNLEFISRLQSFLGESGLKSALFFEISPNPIDAEISFGRAAFRSGKHDAIIA
ncbi:MAG: iron-containing alcohol dehydrogenase, partial [Actinobacteria bacterium]|nr:iron-containing alcohol dehydrogenase [Actinomycetota bacterium]